MMENGDWNFELGNPDNLDKDLLAFENNANGFNEQTLNKQKAAKNNSKFERDDEKEEVSFDPRTGKIVVRQKKVEKMTGVKRTIDEFEKEKYAKMAEDTKVF